MHRNLRAKLYKESYEFVRRQRIQCLLQGPWFVNGIPLSSPQQSTGAVLRKPNRPWRYMRLVSHDPSFALLNLICKQARNMRYIHYVVSGSKFPVRSGNEDLPDKIEISQIVHGIRVAYRRTCRSQCPRSRMTPLRSLRFPSRLRAR